MPIIDSQEYHELALQMIAPDAVLRQPYFHSPLYSWFLAGIYLLFGPQTTAVRVMQSGLSVLSLLLLYALGVRLFSRPAARTAAVMWALYGPVIFFHGELTNVPWILLLNLAGLYALNRAMSAASFGLWLAAGAALGLSAITRPDVLPFAGLMVLWLVGQAAAPS